jgi:site-specific DNA-methyltransferase (adenine-specific)
MWVMINDEWAAHIAIMLEEAGLTQRNWIKWYETFGANCTTKFNRCSRHILYYVRDPKRFHFDAGAAAVRRPSDRQLKYGDKRANPEGKLLDDVWTIPRVCGTFKERVHGVPTQVPLVIMQRIVAVASEPGDLVLDPFSGSGTTGVAALQAGRRYIGIEQNTAFATVSEARLRGVWATP